MSLGWVEDGSLDLGQLEVVRWESCLDDPPLGGPTPWGSSRYDDFMRCPMRYNLAHNKRLTREGIDLNLEIGGGVHEAIARAYQADQQAALMGATDVQCNHAFLSGVNTFCATITKATCAAEVRRLMEGWLVYYGPGAPRDMRWRTLAVEVPLDGGKPFPYTTRIDQIVGDEQDEKAFWIVDHKTARMNSKLMLSSYLYNSQFLGQLWCARQDPAARKWGKLKGTIVDVIVKTNPPQYLQYVVAFEPNTLNQWAKNMRMVWRMLDLYQAMSQWPRLLSNCMRYNKMCRFYDYCRTNGKSMQGLRKKEKSEF